MFKFYFLAVTYGIAFLIIGVCLRKLFVNGDFIYRYKLIFIDLPKAIGSNCFASLSKALGSHIIIGLCIAFPLCSFYMKTILKKIKRLKFDKFLNESIFKKVHIMFIDRKTIVGKDKKYLHLKASKDMFSN
jgi:hypothetical protein